MQTESEAACEDMARLSAVVPDRLLVHSAGRGSCAKSGVKGGDEILLLLVSLGKSAAEYRLVIVEFVGSVSRKGEGIESIMCRRSLGLDA